MNAFNILIFVGLHLFALWPILLIHCKVKKKRPLRKAGKSCESLLGDQGAQSNIPAAAPPAKKKFATASKLHPMKVAKKNEMNSKKESERTDEKKTADRKGGTTAEQQSKERGNSGKAKSVIPSPTKKSDAKQKTSTLDLKTKGVESTQTEKSIATTQLTTKGGRSDKTQSLTEQPESE